MNFKNKIPKNMEQTIQTMTETAFGGLDLLFPQSVVIKELGILSNDELFEWYKEFDEYVIEAPQAPIAKKYVDILRDTRLVPLFYDAMNEEILLGTIKEYKYDVEVPGQLQKLVTKYQVQTITLYDFLERKEKYRYRNFEKQDSSISEIVQSIIDEGISLRAIDITIASKREGIECYYNVAKDKVPTKTKGLYRREMKDIVDYLMTVGGVSNVVENRKPKHFSIDYNVNYRIRGNIVPTYFGYMTTLRLLPKQTFIKSLEELNLREDTIEFLKTEFINNEPGLRILAGPTLSGKNTTTVAALMNKLKDGKYKAVSVESPVELISDVLEQIDCKNEDEYIESLQSLIRMNPDIIYVTEMNDRAAEEVLKIANTGKEVYTSVHSNSVAETFFRLQDLTGLPMSRIVPNVHSIVHQRLLVVDGKLKPITSFYKLTKKDRLELTALNYKEFVEYVERGVNFEHIE